MPISSGNIYRYAPVYDVVFTDPFTTTQVVKKYKCPFHGYVEDTFMITYKDKGLYKDHFYCSRCICDALDLTRAKLTVEEVIIETPSEDNRTVPSGGMSASASPVVDDGSGLDISAAEYTQRLHASGLSSTNSSSGRIM